MCGYLKAGNHKRKKLSKSLKMLLLHTFNMAVYRNVLLRRSTVIGTMRVRVPPRSQKTLKYARVA